MIHLDTTFIILGLVPGSTQDRKLRLWLQGEETLAMSAIAWAELLCGPMPADLLGVATRVVSERVPFHEEDAQLSAQLFNESARRRGSFVDCMIGNGIAGWRHAGDREHRGLSSVQVSRPCLGRLTLAYGLFTVMFVPVLSPSGSWLSAGW